MGITQPGFPLSPHIWDAPWKETLPLNIPPSFYWHFTRQHTIPNKEASEIDTAGGKRSH